MKKIVLISSFCNEESKIEVLHKNIKKYNELGIDTLLISPFSLPDYIINSVSYFFKTKDNVIFKWPFRSMISWSDKNIDGVWYRFNSCTPDYGFAGLYQLKQLGEIAISLGYEKFILTIYDTIITEEIISEFDKEHECTVYPSKRDNVIWNFGLHLLIFNKKNLLKFINTITLDCYLNCVDCDAFMWIQEQVKVLNFNQGNIFVEDEIEYKPSSPLYDSSNSNEYSLFILNNIEFKEPIRIFIYNVKDIDLFTIVVNNHEIIHTENNKIIELHKTIDQLTSVKIIYGDHNQEIIEDIRNVTFNSIEKL